MAGSRAWGTHYLLLTKRVANAILRAAASANLSLKQA
jgi:hypothetical protein